MSPNDLKPSSSSSSEEEETSGSETEQTSGSDSEKKPQHEPQSPDLSSSETEQSGSDTDSDSPPKNSAIVNPHVKPTPSKITSTPPPPKIKRPPPPPAPITEKNTKKPKQITTNGDSKKSSVTTVASSQSGLETVSDLPPKKSAVANPNVKPPPVKMTSSTPPAPIEKHSKKQVKQVPKKASVASSPDLYSSGSESDTDTDSNSNVKPVVSKPMENLESKSAKNSRAKTTSSKNEKEAKNEKEGKQLMIQRLWSEEDEIVLLEGMIRFKSERNGENTIATDIGALHEFIKKSLRVDVSNTQLGAKVRRLKKKYVNNASKGRRFLKSHEQKCYDLSKLIWGSTSGIESKKRSDKDRVMMEVDENENENENNSVDVSRFVQYGGRNEGLIMSEEIVKAGMELVEGDKRAELEGKWRKLKERELELYVQRMELLKEQALMVLEAVRSSGN